MVTPTGRTKKRPRVSIDSLNISVGLKSPKFCRPVSFSKGQRKGGGWLRWRIQKDFSQSLRKKRGSQQGGKEGGSESER